MAKKSMYLAMNNLANFIANTEDTTFTSIWETWSQKYRPTTETVPALKKMGRQLCKLEKSDIKAIPETKYRNIIKKTLQPEIEKGEDNGNRKNNI